VVLRPTLMFGWFDRKHVGWLKRFMERMPVFPIPGDGRMWRVSADGGTQARWRRQDEILYLDPEGTPDPAHPA